MSNKKNQKIWKKVNKALYIHLTDDAKIFIIKGDTGEEKWVSKNELMQELDEIKKVGGELLYSRDNPQTDPLVLVKEIFDEIARYQLPMKIVERHPRAYVGFP